MEGLDGTLVTPRAEIVVLFHYQVYTELIWHTLTHEEDPPGKSVGTFVESCLGNRHARVGL